MNKSHQWQHLFLRYIGASRFSVWKQELNPFVGFFVYADTLIAVVYTDE